jgi:hypothetical protein
MSPNMSSSAPASTPIDILDPDRHLLDDRASGTKSACIRYRPKAFMRRMI